MVKNNRDYLSVSYPCDDAHCDTRCHQCIDTLQVASLLELRELWDDVVYNMRSDDFIDPDYEDHLTLRRIINHCQMKGTKPCIERLTIQHPSGL